MSFQRRCGAVAQNKAENKESGACIMCVCAFVSSIYCKCYLSANIISVMVDRRRRINCLCGANRRESRCVQIYLWNG